MPYSWELPAFARSAGTKRGHASNPACCTAPKQRMNPAKALLQKITPRIRPGTFRELHLGAIIAGFSKA
jgi:hypothetical protein